MNDASHHREPMKVLRLVVFGAILGLGVTSVASAQGAGGSTDSPPSTARLGAGGGISETLRSSLGVDFRVEQVRSTDDGRLFEATSREATDRGLVTCLVGETKEMSAINCEPTERTSATPMITFWSYDLEDRPYFSGRVGPEVARISIGGETIEVVDGLLFGQSRNGDWTAEVTFVDGESVTLDYTPRDGVEILNGKEVVR